MTQGIIKLIFLDIRHDVDIPVTEISYFNRFYSILKTIPGFFGKSVGGNTPN